MVESLGGNDLKSGGETTSNLKVMGSNPVTEHGDQIPFFAAVTDIPKLAETKYLAFNP